MRRVTALCCPVLAVALSVFFVIGDAGLIQRPSTTSRTVGYGELHEEWRGEITQLSWAPRAYLIKGFLTDEECEHLIKLGEPRLKKSTVVDNESGKSIPSSVRTSKGTFLEYALDDVVQRIERRVAQVTMVPIDHQEGLQILKYENGEKYDAHFDYFHDSYNKRPESGGQRLVTMLMYLATVEEGGETVFPNADQRVHGPEWSSCAKQGLAVKPVRGDAVMFYGLKPDGTEDTTSLHGSCPTLKGEKWSATKWIHVMPFRRGHKNKHNCVDDYHECAGWAARGECDKNPKFMKVNCKLSCQVCSSNDVSTT